MSNVYLLATIGFDVAENKPPKGLFNRRLFPMGIPRTVTVPKSMQPVLQVISARAGGSKARQTEDDAADA